MAKELVKKEDLITPENITKEDVKRLFCATATDKELTMFLQIAKLNKLNPLKREIYLVKYKEGTPASILTGYEVYLKRASRSGQYGGFKVWIEGEDFEMKACIDVYRKDFPHPLHHEVDYSEYVQMKWDSESRKRVPNKFWHEKPKTMLKKVVISQGLRFAFPDELAGIPYVREEVNEEINGVEVVEPEKLVVEPLTTPQNEPKPAELAKKEPEVKVDTPQEENPNEKLSMNQRFANVRKSLGEEDYLFALKKFGVKSISEFKKKDKAAEALKALEDIVELEEFKLED